LYKVNDVKCSVLFYFLVHYNKRKKGPRLAILCSPLLIRDSMYRDVHVLQFQQWQTSRY